MGKHPGKRIRMYENGFEVDAPITSKRRCSSLKMQGKIVTGVRGNPNDFLDIALPLGVTAIGDGAFSVLYSDCGGITSITIPDTVARIGRESFNECCELTSVTLPDNLISIGKKAFMNCSGLTSLTLPDSVINIGEFAFCGCAGIISLSLPDNLKFIGHGAFRGVKMKSVFFRPPVSRGAFIAWVVGSSRNRDNWQITTVKQLRNVLRLVTELALWNRVICER